MNNYVTCNGCFDSLHLGHLFYLGFCAGVANAHSSTLVVGVNDDHHIEKVKP